MEGSSLQSSRERSASSGLMTRGLNERDDKHHGHEDTREIKEEIDKINQMFDQILDVIGKDYSLRKDRLTKLCQLFREVARKNAPLGDKLPEPLFLDFVEGIVPDPQISNHSDINQHISFLKQIFEIVSRDSYKTENLDVLQRSKIALDGCVNLDLDGCLLLDPITRNEIRRANCQLLKDRVEEISQNFKNNTYYEMNLIRMQYNNLHFMLEYGLLWEKPELVDSYLKELLIGEPSIKDYLEDLAFNHSLDSSSSEADQDYEKDQEGVYFQNILKLLQMIVHCLLFKNDLAVESLMLKGKNGRRSPFVFEDPETSYLLSKGLIELLDKENSKRYFSHPKVRKMVNVIFHMMLSVESDHSLSNLCGLTPLHETPKIKHFGSKYAREVIDTKFEIMEAVKMIIRKETVEQEKQRKSAPDKEVQEHIDHLLEKLEIFRVNYSAYERFLSAYDFNRSLLWLVLTLLGHYDENSAGIKLDNFLQFINDSVRTSKPLRDLFYTKNNWTLVQILLEIKPSLCLQLLVDSCTGYLEYDGIMERILVALISHISQGLQFARTYSRAFLTPHNHYPDGSLLCQDILEWIYCIQGLIDILDNLTNESSLPKATVSMKIANKTRTRLELVLKNLVAPSINEIIDVIASKEKKLDAHLVYLKTAMTNKHPLQTSKNLHCLIAEAKESYANPMGLAAFNTKLLTKTDPQSTTLVVELLMYILRLFNKSIMYSGTSGLQYHIKLLDDMRHNSTGEAQFFDNLGYLRDYKFGYMFLTEVHALYANLFLVEVEEFTAFDTLFEKNGQNKAAQEVLNAVSTEMFFLKQLDKKLEKKASEADKQLIRESIRNLFASIGLSENLALISNDTQQYKRDAEDSKTDFCEYLSNKTSNLERMIQRSNLFQGDMSSDYMTRIYRAFMAKGVLKTIYKLICSIIYAVPPEDYYRTNVFKVVQCLIDNFGVAERFIKPSTPFDLGDIKNNLKHGHKSANKYTNLASDKNDQTKRSLQLVQTEQLLKVKEFIESIYLDENLSEFRNEISEIARESFRDMNRDNCSNIYKRVRLKENNNLRVMIKNIKSFGEDPRDKPKTVTISIFKTIRGLKRDSISDRGEFIKCLQLGSEYSKSTYFENVTSWICTQIEEVADRTELYPGSNMILYSEVYSMIHILDNLMLFSQYIRTVIHAQHLDAIKQRLTYIEGRQPRSVISYVVNALIQQQREINKSLFASNLALNIEYCFVFTFFLSSLTQNNYTPLKLIIGQMTVDDNKHALTVILSRVALPYFNEEDIKTDKITAVDRADLSWYNVVCLGLLIECLSGPCTENQNLIDTYYKGEYSKLFRICQRIVGSIKNPFYHLQACIAKFLLTIFEGPNPQTIKRLNEYKPKSLYLVITNHLFNLWRYSCKPAKKCKPAKSESKTVKDKSALYIQSLNGPGQFNDSEMVRLNPDMHEPSEFDEKEDDTEIDAPDLDSLMHLYKTDRSFATNSSIVLARTIFLIMTYAESSDLRRYTAFLNEKRQESQALMEFSFVKRKPGKVQVPNQDKNSHGNPLSKIRLITKKVLKHKVDKGDELSEAYLLLFVFLNNVTGTIEISTKSHESDSIKQVRVVFPILPECLFFSPSKVTRFIEHCSVDNQNSRLLELINFSDELLIEIDANIKLFNKSHFLSMLITYEATEVAIWMAWVISLAMNILWLVFAEITKTSPVDNIYERNDIVELVQPPVKATVLVLNMVVVFICTFYLIGWLYNSYGVVLKVNKPKVQRQVDREGRVKRMLLWIKHYIYDCLVLQGQPAILFLHIIFVILYYFGAAIFMTFHLLLFVYHFETTRFIINSVTLHLSKILTALVFIVFVTYCSSTIISYHYGDAFMDEFRTMQLTDSWISSATFMFDYGNQAGGGIGEYMLQLPSDHKYFFAKIVVSIVFFLLVKLIFTNIMLGIIVDTFMELRENQAGHRDKVANECFICGLNRTEFEKRDKPFDFHVKREHTILSYLYYMIYLKKKNVNDFSGTELYVYNLLVKMKRTDWFPFQETIFLGKLLLIRKP